MRNQIRKCWSLTTVALLCLAAGASAQNGTRTEESSKTQKALTAGLAPAVAQHASGQKAIGPRMISQKLVLQVEESPAPILLAADFLGLAAMILLFRKRMALQRVRIGSRMRLGR